MKKGPLKILILCTGNSCRSQMAHGFLHAMDNRMTVFSAGTNPANEVNAQAVMVMKEAGIDISHHKPQSVNIFLNEKWDYVITVCDDANETCPFFPGEVRHRLHLGFEDPSHTSGTKEHINSEFRRVRDLIRNEFQKLFETRIKPEIDE